MRAKVISEDVSPEPSDRHLSITRETGFVDVFVDVLVDVNGFSNQNEMNYAPDKVEPFS